MEVQPASARADLLRRVTLFDGFGADEIQRLASLCTEISLEKGETLCRKGDEGEQLFIITSGELEVWGGPQDTRLLSRLQPGEFLGELCLLVGGKRNATVTVARAARLLAIDKAVFDQFLRANPTILGHLSLVLARRLAMMARGDTVASTTTTVAVMARPGLLGKTLVASSLAVLLRDLTRNDVLLVNLAGHPRTGQRRSEAPLLSELVREPTDRLKAELVTDSALAPELSVAVESVRNEYALVEELSALIAKLSDSFPMVVFDLGAGPGPLPRAVESVSDFVIEIVDRCVPEDSSAAMPGRRCFKILNLHNAGCTPISISHCQPFVIPDDPTLRDLRPMEQAGHIRDNRWSPASLPLQRLARKLLGATVGLALGGGAAFGIAHVGVLKVLEEDGIPVDLIAGSSMGSIVAAGYAAGIRPAEMIDIANRVGTWQTTVSLMLDFTLSKPAILSGHRVAQIFSPVTSRAKTFEELMLPCRTVAADIETGQRVAISEGRLDLAYRASSAVPVVWAPIKVGGRVLVDGSLIDPVPGEVVREMDADLCVAVNVVPPLKRGVETVLAHWYRRLNRLNPFAYLGSSQDMPSIFDLWMNTIQMVQRELGNYKAISADVLISPDLTEFTWIEFYRARELIERGATAAERALPEIRRLIAKRIEAPGWALRVR